VVGAAVIVTAGALGDVFGRRRIFTFGLILFVASCVFIALFLEQYSAPGGKQRPILGADIIVTMDAGANNDYK
jgi:MFS family permease